MNLENPAENYNKSEILRISLAFCRFYSIYNQVNDKFIEYYSKIYHHYWTREECSEVIWWIGDTPSKNWVHIDQ